MNRKSIKEKADSCEPSGHTGAQYNDGPSGKNNGGQLGLWAVAANTKFVSGFMVITTVTIGCIYSVVYTIVLPSIGRLEALENRVKELETAINQCNINCPDVGGIQNDIDKIQGKITVQQKNIYEINSTQNRITDFIKRFGDKIWDEVDTTSLRLSNLEMAPSNQIWYNILGHCFVLVIGILMFLVLGNQKPDQVSSVGVIGACSRRDVPQKSWTIRNVLDEIQRRPLEKRLCIISFYAETQNLHKRLTDSACGGTGIDQQAVLIARHENIPNLPPCQICLVFVDFNERDIILENSKREVGDLKLTTVKGARKMGGDVFVIYVRDKGSKALESGHLFNPKLMSIHNHDELKDLNSRKRVLSTYEGFSQYQIEHLSTCLNVLR